MYYVIVIWQLNPIHVKNYKLYISGLEKQII